MAGDVCVSARQGGDMKIAICASEVVPFAKTGGLADVVGALSLALAEEDQEVIVVMPHYKDVDRKKFGIHRISPDISYCTVAGKLRVYFIENKQYFFRQGLYQDSQGDYRDNLERFAYYCRRVLYLFKEIKFQPDIIHVHDWQTCLIPVYLKALYSDDKFYKDARTVLTVHNIGYQGIFPKEGFLKLGLDWNLFDVEGLEFYGNINILKGGIVFSDLINTVSPTYSREIRTKEFGFGLEGILNKRRNSLSGILNGLDYDIWDPKKDKFIAANFSIMNIEDKAVNKSDLQRRCNLSLREDVPLLGIVSRLAQQKGFDIISEAMEEICALKVQIAVLGMGDVKYTQMFQEAVKRYPNILSFNCNFDDPLAHKIYAGADIFLMPSRYEPCGLGQLIALRYGTIPVVFKTGGLADTVEDSNGFIFDSYSSTDLVKAIKIAVKTFSNKKKWYSLVLQAMKRDFSWKASTGEYLKLYEKARLR